MNILIVKTSAIGDVTHTLPALNVLHDHFPDAKISWLIEEAASEIISEHPFVHRVLISKRKYWIKQFKNGKWFSVLREISHFVKQLRDTQYDLILDFQNLLKSGVFIGLARGKRKVGFGKGMEHSELSYLFLNEKIPAVDMNQHAIRRELQLLQAIGINHDKIVLDIPVSQNHLEFIRSVLEKKGITIGKTPLVSINPVATWPTKLWYEDRFAHIGDVLLEKNISVVFTGGPEDKPAIDQICSKMNTPAINLAGETSLISLLALYKISNLVISTDTGPMHLAAAVSTPVIALFGATAPWRTGPFGKQHVVLRKELPCSPCLKRECDIGIICMEQITTDEVITAVEKKAKGHFRKLSLA